MKKLSILLAIAAMLGCNSSNIEDDNFDQEQIAKDIVGLWIEDSDVSKEKSVWYYYFFNDGTIAYWHGSNHLESFVYKREEGKITIGKNRTNIEIRLKYDNGSSFIGSFKEISYNKMIGSYDQTFTKHLAPPRNLELIDSDQINGLLVGTWTGEEDGYESEYFGVKTISFTDKYQISFKWQPEPIYYKYKISFMYKLGSTDSNCYQYRLLSKSFGLCYFSLNSDLNMINFYRYPSHYVLQRVQ